MPEVVLGAHAQRHEPAGDRVEVAAARREGSRPSGAPILDDRDAEEARVGVESPVESVSSNR